MKAIYTFMLLISFNALAEVTLQDCLVDSLMNGDNKTPVQPLPECLDIIKDHPDHINVTSSNQRWKAVGIGHMLYLDNLDKDGKLIERFLLSGNQTELVAIRKVFIDTTFNRLFIIQVKNEVSELMVHDLTFIGNVSPLNVMRAPEFLNAVSLRMENEENIELVNPSGTFLINSDGESRQELSWRKNFSIKPR